MAVSKSLRFQVFRRDGHTCQYCGGRPPDVALVVDHVVPAALGGSDEPANLVTSCRDCNTGKSATPPDAAMVEQVGDRERQYRAELDRLAVVAADDRRARDLDWFRDLWGQWACGVPGSEGGPVPLPSNWAGSVRVWLRRGLTVDDVTYATGKAMENASVESRDAFRYMAGICWRMLSEREAQAEQRVSATTPVDRPVGT